MSTARMVISDDHSNHNLPIGAVVEPTDPPDWADGDADWYTQGADGDEVAIDPRDLVPVEDGPEKWVPEAIAEQEAYLARRREERDA